MTMEMEKHSVRDIPRRMGEGEKGRRGEGEKGRRGVLMFSATITLKRIKISNYVVNFLFLGLKN